MNQPIRTIPRVLVLGSSGQLGLALQRQDAPGLDIEFASRNCAEFTEPGTLRQFVSAAKADLIINAAAYTDVDAAEADEADAIAVNSIAVEAIAQGARQSGAAFLHISTDYVFDGDLKRPYSENDHAAPLNMYGATKLLGEELAQLANPRTAILRTAWLFSQDRRNFVKSILSASERRDELLVVGDQTGNPTPVADLARACLAIASQLIEAGPLSDVWGVTHCAGPSSCSRADFAHAVVRSSGNTHARVVPVATTDWPLAAPRPKSTDLDCRRLARVFGVSMPAWELGLRDVVEALTESSIAEVA